MESSATSSLNGTERSSQRILERRRIPKCLTTPNLRRADERRRFFALAEIVAWWETMYVRPLSFGAQMVRDGDENARH